MITFIIFLLVLSVLVFVHEFGHFITSKRAGLRVDEFGFGFPPRVVGIRKTRDLATSAEVAKSQKRFEIIRGTPKDFDARQGGTLYSINILPFGGFVKIKGESGEEEKERDSFASRGALQRILILSSGVLMNVVLAVVLIAVGYVVGFPQALQDNISKYARIEHAHIEVVGILPDGPAAKAGIEMGTKIIAGNGKEFSNAEELTGFVTEFLNKPVRLTIEDDKGRQEKEFTPILLKETQKPGIGIAILDIGVVRYPLWLAVPKAFELTGILIKTIVVAIGGLIYNAIIGQPVSADLAGPVGIAVMTGQAARQGFIYLLQFMAMLSINLAVLNIIPFPALDGGRILFIAIEKIIRRPVPRRVEGWIHASGFALLILLVLFVTYRDIGRYGGWIMKFFHGVLTY